MRVFSWSEYQRIPLLGLPTALVRLTNKSASKLGTNSRRRRRHHYEAVRREQMMEMRFFCLSGGVRIQLGRRCEWSRIDWCIV